MSALITVTSDMKPHETKAEELTKGIATLKVKATAIQITSDETRTECMNILMDAKGRKSGLDKFFEGIKRPVNDIRKLILDMEKTTLADTESVIKICDDKLKAFDKSMLEAKRKMEEQAARDAAKQQRELEAKKRELLSEGYVAEAKEVEHQTMLLQHMPELPPAISRVAGASVSIPCVAKVTDLRMLIVSIGNRQTSLMYEINGEMRSLLMIDQPVLNSLVKRLGKGLEIPGVTVEEDITYRRTGKP